MGTSSLYFSALTTSAKNFHGHRGLSIAIPVSAFGLSSFWEALVAGSALFRKTVRAEGGEIAMEIDVARLFRFFALLLGVVGVIGSVGLVVIPSQSSKRVGVVEEATEEDALLPRTQESEARVNGYVSVREELTLEQRPFLTDKSTYFFGLALLVLLGSGEMFINCVCVFNSSADASSGRCYKHSDPLGISHHPSIQVGIFQCSPLQVP